ncbi:hypothetical protein FHG87_017888 [Trinorchestia longiramus]|nr:hypothetical protein FHG87_017888 [Trinorchestia longiramus]
MAKRQCTGGRGDCEINQSEAHAWSGGPYTRSAEQRSAEQRSAEQRSAEQRSAEQRSAEQRSAEQRSRA